MPFTMERTSILGLASPFVRSSIDPPLSVPLALVVSKQFSLWQEGFCRLVTNILPLTRVRFSVRKKNLIQHPHK